MKIISIQKEKFPENALNGDLINCENVNQLKEELQRNSSRVIILACNHSQLGRLKSILQRNRNIKTVFIRTNFKQILFPVELFALRDLQFLPICKNKTKLFEHFCIKAMEHYFHQALIHRMNEDQGLADLSLLQATNASQQLKSLLEQ